ncbi:MAG: hypothetical protein OMM_11556, partial [Candidatus Magnetoglobus multicellularis str. Araruama]
MRLQRIFAYFVTNRNFSVARIALESYKGEGQNFLEGLANYGNAVVHAIINDPEGIKLLRTYMKASPKVFVKETPLIHGAEILCMTKSITCTESKHEDIFEFSTTEQTPDVVYIDAPNREFNPLVINDLVKPEDHEVIIPVIAETGSNQNLDVDTSWFLVHTTSKHLSCNGGAALTVVTDGMIHASCSEDTVDIDELMNAESQMCAKAKAYQNYPLAGMVLSVTPGTMSSSYNLTNWMREQDRTNLPNPLTRFGLTPLGMPSVNIIIPEIHKFASGFSPKETWVLKTAQSSVSEEITGIYKTLLTEKINIDPSVNPEIDLMVRLMAVVYGLQLPAVSSYGIHNQMVFLQQYGGSVELIIQGGCLNLKRNSVPFAPINQQLLEQCCIDFGLAPIGSESASVLIQPSNQVFPVKYVDSDQEQHIIEQAVFAFRGSTMTIQDLMAGVHGYEIVRLVYTHDPERESYFSIKIAQAKAKTKAVVPKDFFADYVSQMILLQYIIDIL